MGREIWCVCVCVCVCVYIYIYRDKMTIVSQLEDFVHFQNFLRQEGSHWTEMNYVIIVS